MASHANRGKGYNRAQRRRIAHELRKMGITEAVRINPPMLDWAASRRSLDGTAEFDTTNLAYRISVENPMVFFYRSSTSDEEYPVWQKGKTVICACPAYADDRLGGCEHVAHYCELHDINHPAVQRYRMRRIGETFTVYPDGLAETTRDDKADAEEDPFVREQAYVLCRDMKDPRPVHTRGRTREFDLKIAAYALLIKTAFGLKYERLGHDLIKDAFFAKLGWLGPVVPSKRTLIELTTMDGLFEALQAALEMTARPGRNIDFAFALDSSGFGSTPKQNWYEDVWVKEKEGPEKDEASKDQRDNADVVPVSPTPQELRKRRRGRPRKSESDERSSGQDAEEEQKTKRPYVKAHVAYGIVSGLIYAVNLTLNVGEGTADVEHFEELVTRTLENCNARIILADKGYRDQESFRLAQGLRRILFILAKKRQNPDDAPLDADSMAFIHWLAMKHPDMYRRFYRLRMKIESLFSAKKRRAGHTRLRVRAEELRELPYLTYPPKLENRIERFGDATAYSPAPSKEAAELRSRICRMIAKRRIGVSRQNEMLARAIVWNLTRLLHLKWEHDDEVDLLADKAFKPMRCIDLPGDVKAA